MDYEDLGDSYRIHGIDGHVDLPKAMIDRFEPSPTPADVVAMFSEVAVADVHEALAQLVAEFISLRVRVLSYNIHHGEGVDGQLDLRRIADVIKSVKPDLVALQEVDAGTQRTNRVDQPAELARLTGMHVVFGGNIAYQGGRYGNAVLSRFPIKRHKNHLLPRLNNGEQRGLLSVEVALPGEGGTLVFLATHLDHRKDDAERLASARLINKLAQAKADQPAVLAGDLNDLPGSRTLREIETLWTRANERVLPTFPVDRPARQIDFILFRPADRWNVIETRVLDEAVASDHRPILAVLALRSGKGE